MNIPTACMAIFAAALALVLASCHMRQTPSVPLGRAALQYKRMLSEKASRNHQLNSKHRLAYAQTLFELGALTDAQEQLRPCLSSQKPAADATYLFAHCQYLQGDYAAAEKLFGSISSINAPLAKKINAQIGLMGTAYQTNQYHKAQALFKGYEGTIQLALWELMKHFGNEQPYQLRWHGTPHAVVPFVASEPLPVVSIYVNGQPIQVLVDTGAELLYLDETLAHSLGITAVTRQVEPYAGGLTAEVGYARADSVQIGNATLSAIPVKLGNIQRFSSMFPHPLKISGILSTGILQQFLATIDYPNAQLILRPRSEQSRMAWAAERAQSHGVEVPFTLAMTHIMVVKGSINGKDSLNLFLDSGLAHASAALLLPKQSLDYLGIPPPATQIDPKSLGGLGGSGNLPTGLFPIDHCSIGSLQQHNLTGLYGLFPPQLYQGCEFVIDGIVSHNFLKHYAWTINFDVMTMHFAQKG